jgi:outer membrane lipoprotein-sorting protein
MLFKIRNPYVLAIAMLILVVSLAETNAANSTDRTASAKQLLSAIPPPGQMLTGERTVDATNFIGDMADAAQALKSYSFDYQTTVFKGSKQVNQAGSFWFKQPPRMLRVEMTGDYKRGAVAVLGKDGKVRGHLGGALGAFTVTLAPDSDMLLGANGYPLVDSDFAGMAKVIGSFIAQGCKSKVTEHPVSVEGQTQKVYVLEILKGSELYKRAYIDPKSMLPVEWFDYKDGRLFARTVWQNLKFDANINEDKFKI